MGNILTKSESTIHRHRATLLVFYSLVRVLFNEAFGFLVDILYCLSVPPVRVATIYIKMSTMRVKGVGEFMASNSSESSIIQIFRNFFIEERELHDRGWENNSITRRVIIWVDMNELIS